MKEVIVNILIFILFFNIIMLVFPEGKTQKYCKIVIKLFVLVYIINNILLNGAISLDGLVNLDWIGYSNEIDNKREISIEDTDSELILLLNQELYGGEEVIGDIILFFDDKTELSALIYLNKNLNIQEQSILKNEISSIFNVKVKNIKI